MECEFWTDRCRGQAELNVTEECHEFRIQLQTCDADLIKKIEEWMMFGGSDE